MIDLLVFALSLLILLAIDLTTVSAQAAFQSASYARLLSLREQFGERTQRAVELHHAHARTQASLDLLLTLTRFLLAGWVILLFRIEVPSLEWGWDLLILAGAGVIVFFVEYIIGSLGRHNPEQTLIRLSSYIRFWTIIFTPFTFIPLAVSKDSAKAEEPSSLEIEDELQTMLDAGQQEGVIEQDERRMINSVIDLGDTLAREIMVPRVDILAVDVNTPVAEAIEVFLSSGHSRVPVYDENIDHMLGLVFAKDLLHVWRDGAQLDSLRSLLRQAYFVPEAKRLDALLEEMQSQRTHMVLVVDEYGGIAGLVTLEDIVEEVLGEIRDEYDQAEELPYQKLKGGDIIFQGRIDLDDFNEVMGSGLKKDEADTLSGFMYNRLGHVPAAGEKVQVGHLLLVVEQVSARQIRKVRARWLVAEEQKGEPQDE